ncbi:MAG: recombinase family protein [Lachnospiraceae bacterium]|nr:recombinase family protein [Lachnospiraceae bacterium]
MARIYGYVRVSTKYQNEDRQMIAMKEMQIPSGNIYMDKQSGKDFDRPKYQELLHRLEPEDLIYVKSIDRLGRNYEEILEQWRILTKEKGSDVVVIDMPLLDTRRGKDLLGTFIADIMLQLLSFVAENERSNIRQRQAEGIAAARLRGVRFGRPQKEAPEDFSQIVRAWEEKSISFEEAVACSGLSESTFYRRLREMRQNNKSAVKKCTF